MDKEIPVWSVVVGNLLWKDRERCHDICHDDLLLRA